ncbi:hypothetical protein BC937DRAFT_91072 [Endogone sp. FLAS-F59071]|nr:hypothetical protein BC937DRAFT_91072 [Endogone sp. FLAS-F59071]|eukprot:RUS21905.1 hypothetical protein BC937DRAFT_91072 [Endogone sp. FLAS-F59071]
MNPPSTAFPQRHLSPSSSLQSSSQPPRRRARNLLRNYYGIAPIPEKKPNPLDIDNPFFEPDKYFQKLLHEKPLNGLLQRDNDLVTEIRQLDGDMKTLVYENYSKFISATDTIRKMKSNVQNMESEMDRLTNNMSKITEQCATVNTALGPRREKIQQLNGVHNLLKKLQFIFELPNRLNQCLANESYAQAVQYYSRTTHLLAHYRHLSVFDGIEGECKEIMEKVAEKIREQMRSEKASMKQISEYVALLIVLKEPPRELWKEHIKLQTAILADIKTRVLESLASLPLQPPPAKPAADPTVAEGGQELTPSTQPADRITHLNNAFLKELNSFVEVFCVLFLTVAPASAGGGGRRSMSQTTGAGELGLGLLANAGLGVEDYDQARRDLLAAIDSLLSAYFGAVHEMVTISTEILKQPRPIPHLHILSVLSESAEKDFDALCDIAAFDDRVRDVVAEWEIGVAKCVMGGAGKGLMDRLQAFAKTVTKDPSSSSALSHVTNPDLLATFVIDTEEWFNSYLTLDCLPFVEECVNADATFLVNAHAKETFLARIREGLKEGWEDVVVGLEDDSLPPLPVLSLLSSRLCLDLSDSVITFVYEAFSRRLYPNVPRRPASSPYRADVPATQIAPVLVSDARDVALLCKETGQRLLDYYTQHVSHHLVRRMQRYHLTHNWLTNDNPPARVSPVWETVLEELGKCEADVEVIYPGTDGDNDKADHSSESTPSGRGNGHRYSAARVPGSTSPLPGSNAAQLSTGARATTNGGLGTPSNMSVTSFTSVNSGQPPFLSAGPGTGGAAGFDLAHQSLLTNIDKLFSERVEIFGKVDPTKNGVCGAVVKCLLKAYIETIRGLTLTKGGFWQVQVDAEWLKVCLWRFVVDEK